MYQCVVPFESCLLVESLRIYMTQLQIEVREQLEAMDNAA